MAIAEEADATIGPMIVEALARTRAQGPLSRAYVKNVEVKVGGGSPPTFEPMWPVLGPNPADLTKFRTLAGWLFAELVVEQPAFDPHAGELDAHAMLAALRELLVLCSAPYRPPSATGGPVDASGLAAMATAIGTSVGAALGSHLPKPAAAEKVKGKKVTVERANSMLASFNGRPNGEMLLGAHEIANRTLMGLMHEYVVENGLFPVCESLTIDAMAPLASATGAINATDVPSMMFNPSTGLVEDASRDPKAKAAATAEEYIAKVHIFFFTMVVLLHGVKCDTEPHLVPGHESEDFCSLVGCNAFLGFVKTLTKVPLTLLKPMMECTLQDIAKMANDRTGERASFAKAIKHALVELRRRAEPSTMKQMAAEASVAGPSGSGSEAAAKAAGSQQQPEATAKMAEMIASAVATSLAGLLPKLIPAGGEGRRAADDRKKREREAEVEYEIGGAAVRRKSKKGGYDDAPRCTNGKHFKDSWCPYSHAHL